MVPMHFQNFVNEIFFAQVLGDLHEVLVGLDFIFLLSRSVVLEF
jgi:hypothetical protein